MRHLSIPFAAVIAASLAFAGCSTVESIESNLASPTTSQAAANVKVFAQAFACGLSAAAAAAQGVATQEYNGTSVVDAKGQQIIGIVYASSTAACSLLGGKILSSTPVAVPVASVVQ